MEEKTFMTKKERRGFGWAGFGQNMIYCIMSMWLMYYYTDVFFNGVVASGMATAQAITASITLCMTLARIWDAINDPIMGNLVDRITFKNQKEKFRPYLKVTPFLITISTIMLFTNFFGETQYIGKMIYMYITYFIWGMIYTVADIPFWGLSSVMTPNEKERADFIAKSRIYCTVGAIVPMVFMMMMDFIVPNNQQLKYFLSALIIAVSGGSLFMLAYLTSKERIVLPREPKSLKHNFKMLAKNKPLLLVLIAGIIGGVRMMAQSAAIYVATDNYAEGFTLLGMEIVKAGSSNMENTITTILGAGFGVGLFVGVGLGPMLARRFNYKAIYIYSSIFGFITQTILFFVGYQNTLLVLILLLFAGLPMGIYNMLTYNMIADSADYMEWKTGERNEGMCFSFQTFMTKLAAGMATMITGVVFLIVGRNADDVIKPENVRNATFALVSLVPALGCLASVFPILFYDFIGKKKENILKELDDRRIAAKAIVDAENALLEQ